MANVTKGLTHSKPKSASSHAAIVIIDMPQKNRTSSFTHGLNSNVNDESLNRNGNLNGNSPNPSSKDVKARLSKKPSNAVAVFNEEVIPDYRDPEFLLSIDRDYSGASAPKGDVIGIRFRTEFPIELDGAIPVEKFKNTILGVNNIFAEAEKMNCGTVTESVFSFLTCFLINLCKKTRMERALDTVAEFLYEENNNIYHPKGLHVVHPYARGLRKIVIRSIAKYNLYRHEDSLSDAEVEH